MYVNDYAPYTVEKTGHCRVFIILKAPSHAEKELPYYRIS